MEQRSMELCRKDGTLNLWMNNNLNHLIQLPK
jgi:hypothetical protein